ncbi:hypothetical protein [Jeotgalibacillus alimentarius]|nr:hypothetical protein [Jeotgalibacillus alimentarius]
MMKLQSKQTLWLTATGYGIMVLLITLAITLSVYPGGYDYMYDESSQQITLERGMFVKEDITIEVTDNPSLQYVLYQTEVNQAIQSWVMLLTLGILAVYLLQRIIPAYRKRKENGFKGTNILHAVLLGVSIFMMIYYLTALTGSIQYMEQVFNTAID